ncbi:MAG: PDZ domain-containing protein [Puniceicoccales bacterium]|jgi:hypothetical protein|nr:PDZ domain-containing protein [Puniceicoccales bacterium]
MKNHTRNIPLHMLLFAGLLPAVSATAQDTTTPTAATPPPLPPVAAQSKIAPDAPLHEVAFLGIQTAQADASTRQLLALTDGTGLRVQFVAAQSPAHAKLQTGDVLVRLDEQILCNHEQLRALIRAKKPGDTITLTLLRDGKTTEVKVQLTGIALGAVGLPIGQLRQRPSLLPEVRIRIDGRDVPLHDLLEEHIAQYRGGVITIDPDAFKDLPDDVREQIRDMQKNFRQNIQRHFDSLWERFDDNPNNHIIPLPHAHPLPRIEITPDEGDEAVDINAGTTVSVNSVKVNGAETTVSVQDRDGTACLTMRDGCRCLKFQDAAGKVLFDGPVDTPTQRADMPAPVAKKLEILEQLGKKDV